MPEIVSFYNDFVFYSAADSCWLFCLWPSYEVQEAKPLENFLEKKKKNVVLFRCLQRPYNPPLDLKFTTVDEWMEKRESQVNLLLMTWRENFIWKNLTKILNRLKICNANLKLQL
jgi:hypothetical protein